MSYPARAEGLGKNDKRKHRQHNDDFNERRNTLLYKNIPLTFYLRKGWCWWEVSWRRVQTATYWPKVLLTIAALLSRPGWAAQPWVTEGWFSLRHLVPQLTPTASGTRTDSLKPSVAPGYIIVWRPPNSCGHTHGHRIQPRPQIKVIFRYLRPDAPVSLLHRDISWLTARSRVYMLQN